MDLSVSVYKVWGCVCTGFPDVHSVAPLLGCHGASQTGYQHVGQLVSHATIVPYPGLHNRIDTPCIQFIHAGMVIPHGLIGFGMLQNSSMHVITARKLHKKE